MIFSYIIHLACIYSARVELEVERLRSCVSGNQPLSVCVCVKVRERERAR